MQSVWFHLIRTECHTKCQALEATGGMQRVRGRFLSFPQTPGPVEALLPVPRLGSCELSSNLLYRMSTSYSSSPDDCSHGKDRVRNAGPKFFRPTYSGADGRSGPCPSKVHATVLEFRVHDHASGSDHHAKAAIIEAAKNEKKPLLK